MRIVPIPPTGAAGRSRKEALYTSGHAKPCVKPSCNYFVDNGWIVTAPGDDEDDYFSEPKRRVFQFADKPSMLAFVDEATPAPKEKAE